MSKFKIGDVVVLTEDYDGVEEGTLLTIQGGEGSHDPHDRGLWYASGLRYGVFGRRLELYSRPVDDELPPAPESVLYINEPQWGLRANSLGDVLQIGIGNPNSPNHHGWTYASLDADTALQLCHDLRRMAMDLKRKEKQSG